MTKVSGERGKMGEKKKVKGKGFETLDVQVMIQMKWQWQFFFPQIAAEIKSNAALYHHRMQKPEDVPVSEIRNGRVYS